MDQGYDARGVLLDISKAFDKIWHKGLLHKLKENDINVPLLNVLEEFLSSRKQRIVLSGQHSSWNDVVAGVPQGSFFFFSLCEFSFTNIHESQDCRERGRAFH